MSWVLWQRIGANKLLSTDQLTMLGMSQVISQGTVNQMSWKWWGRIVPDRQTYSTDKIIVSEMKFVLLLWALKEREHNNRTERLKFSTEPYHLVASPKQSALEHNLQQYCNEWDLQRRLLSWSWTWRSHNTLDQHSYLPRASTYCLNIHNWIYNTFEFSLASSNRTVTYRCME
jgi:hypothetical protein